MSLRLYTICAVSVTASALAGLGFGVIIASARHTPTAPVIQPVADSHPSAAELSSRP